MILRRARKGDEGGILALVKELAEYERAPDSVINTVEQLGIDLFQDQICACFVAEKDNTIIGIALYYISYSTWRGRSMYLEDLYVQPKHRGEQLGYLLFELVREEAIRLNCKRMDWQVLDWNEPAIKFYEKLGAELDGEWLNGRLYFD